MEGQGENDELYPIAVLIDELKVRERYRFHPCAQYAPTCDLTCYDV
jgi:hypothetical protein